MANDDFEDWFVSEKSRHAEAAHKDVAEALTRTKGRAVSLLGWCITLASGCVAAASQSQRHKIEAAVAALGFTAAAFSCVRVLYSTPQSPIAITPSDYDKILTEDDPRSKRGVLTAFNEMAEEAIVENRKHVVADQIWLRRAWVSASLTPICSLLVAAVVWLIRRAGS